MFVDQPHGKTHKRQRHVLTDDMCVWQVSPAGEPLRSLTDMDGQTISGISGVVEHGGRLYFGFLSGNYVAYVDMKAALGSKQQILA